MAKRFALASLPPQAAPAMRDSGETSVLVVESDPAVLATVSDALSGEGYACRTCRSPDEALRAARETAPDVVVCKEHLAGVRGPDLCEQLRRLLGLQRLATLYLSATQGPDVIRRRGAYFLRKPLDGDVLVALVERSLGATACPACI